VKGGQDEALQVVVALVVQAVDADRLHAGSPLVAMRNMREDIQ
jgi:hypothetical protein